MSSSMTILQREVLIMCRFMLISCHNIWISLNILLVIVLECLGILLRWPRLILPYSIISIRVPWSKRCKSPNSVLSRIIPVGTGFPVWSRAVILVPALWWPKPVFSLIFLIFARCGITTWVIEIALYSTAIDNPGREVVWQEMLATFPPIHHNSCILITLVLQLYNPIHDDVLKHRYTDEVTAVTPSVRTWSRYHT